MSKYVLAKHSAQPWCALFMMNANDFRLDGKDYKIVDASPLYDRKTKRLTSTLGVFAVASDRSCKKVA